MKFQEETMKFSVSPFGLLISYLKVDKSVNAYIPKMVNFLRFIVTKFMTVTLIY